MRRTLPLLAALALLAAGSASAESPAPTSTPPAPGAQGSRRSSLDDLFTRLAAAKDADEAKGVAGLIERRFQRSGSDTADLLMQRAAEAFTAEDQPLAVELLDRVTQIVPGWAEAWNRRAAVFFQLEDPDQAFRDIQDALTREPRHFGAWTALGHIELSTGNKKGALAAYRRALAIHPFLEDVKAVVERLTPEVDGRDL